MKELITALLAAFVAVVAFTFISGSSASIGGVVANTPTHTVASVSSTDEVGPQENVRVVATTSRRSYLLLTSEGDGNVPVYCEGDQDKAATSGEGVRLSTSTDMSFEFSADKGNLYVGSVRCTATASTTLLIVEYAD